MFYPFLIYGVGWMILSILFLVAPLELIHHMMLLVAHERHPQRLLEPLLRPLQGHVLIAEDLREEGAEVPALHEGLVLPAKLLLQVLILLL